MAGSVRPRGRVAGLVAVAVALLAGLSPAQPPTAREGGTTLYLVVRTKPDVQDSQVIDTFEAGLKEAKHRVDGKPAIKPVSPSFFEQFAELIGSTPPRDATADAAPAGQVEVQPLPAGGGPLFEVRLPSPKQTLTKLVVQYKPADGKPPSEEYAPKPPGGGPLELTAPGRYAFRPAAGREPEGYSATVDERDEKTRELVRGKELAGKWPTVNKFYVVTLKNFRPLNGGRPDHEQFLQVVEKQSLDAANPIQITRLGGDQLFVFADMAGDAAEIDEEPIYKDHILHFRRRGPAMRNTKRIWALFPLTEAQYQEAVKKYAAFPTRDLPAELRKNAVTEKQDATVRPDTLPRWVELPPDPAAAGTFYRPIPLDDIPGLVSKYPTMWQLTVWEHERTDANGQPVREAILVKNQDGQNVAARGSRLVKWSGVAKDGKK